MSHTVIYPCSGLLAPGTPVTAWERDDQGKDLVIPWQGIWRSPGDGECVMVGHDAAFPDGFGPNFAIMRWETGPFAVPDGSGQNWRWYFGHCTSLVSPGQRVKFQDPVARADQGKDFEGSSGGWTEFGTIIPGTWECGPNLHGGAHWFDDLLRKDLVVQMPDPAILLKQGAGGWRVFHLTSELEDCGYLTHRGSYFDGNVKTAVEQYQKHHRLNVDGIVGSQTQAVLDASTRYCKAHNTKEV